MNDFFVATTTASASFIGLLFVAISFLQDKLKGGSAQLERIIAENSYTSLINIFFISLVGLIPDTRLGYVIFFLGWTGLANNGRFVRAARRSGASSARSYTFLAFSGFTFAFEVIYGIYCIVHPSHRISQYTIMTLIFVLFALALTRAWELTGIKND